MRITSKGQVTIPIDIREKAGLLPGMEVEFEYDGDVVRLVRPATPGPEARGEKIVAHLKRRPWRRNFEMHTDELVKLLRGE